MDALAKFHVIVHKVGRIVIPIGTRKFYNINQGDVVEVTIKKYNDGKKPKEGTFTAKVGEHGSIFIPKHLRKVMNIKPGDIIEVLLLAHYKDGGAQRG
ncbi:AbrB/MazE/SpoVT family DNA-binding domain-containing protein [Thermococcus sp. Bubb.Bath]|uniref:AbrB/MazE/SpoVT family DNA-binding domain-containing protein n=1 Tax=Thermococcus sp. Bubb.Bath TaxID=1638242 RepID=UPI00143A622D|nr:AbrB/MazE/SpoVT family DNA-binding domain-containing protein [Thermococcus sp. Bubb.Bath]NJF25165.1 AbrB family transcriptional regulator [Thermococcus sp. Bubb.Bath]